MIPPANTIQDESGAKEEEREQDETPKSPTANASQPETKVGLSGCPLVLLSSGPVVPLSSCPVVFTQTQHRH